MAKRPSNSRQSVSSGISIPASLDNITSFEEYLTMAQEMPPREQTPPPPPVPPPPAAAAATSKETKESKKSNKYGIRSIIARNRAAVSKKENQNFVEMNKQKLQAEQREREQREREREQREQRRPSTWRNLIKGVLDLQRGKIPLLLAVEAGNQSMVRELLSAQTAEQLQVSWNFFSSSLFGKKRKKSVRN